MSLAHAKGDDDPLRQRAARLFAERRQRDIAFSSEGELFGEPAWDLMLDLFVRPIGREVERIMPGRGWSTQERYILLLESRGLIVRSNGQRFDRECVTLSKKGDIIVRGYLADLVAADCP